jgi:hypothetical protein
VKEIGEGMKLIFDASIPPGKGAIVCHGDEGARIMFDIPESSMGSVVQLLRLRKKHLVLTIELPKESYE